MCGRLWNLLNAVSAPWLSKLGAQDFLHDRRRQDQALSSAPYVEGSVLDECLMECPAPGSCDAGGPGVPYSAAALIMMSSVMLVILCVFFRNPKLPWCPSGIH